MLGGLMPDELEKENQKRVNRDNTKNEIGYGQRQSWRNRTRRRQKNKSPSSGIEVLALKMPRTDILQDEGRLSSSTFMMKPEMHLRARS